MYEPPNLFDLGAIQIRAARKFRLLTLPQNKGESYAVLIDKLLQIERFSVGK